MQTGGVEQNGRIVRGEAGEFPGGNGRLGGPVQSQQGVRQLRLVLPAEFPEHRVFWPKGEGCTLPQDGIAEDTDRIVEFVQVADIETALRTAVSFLGRVGER